MVEPVIFRMGIYGDVFALLPFISGGRGLCTVYNRVGQHGAANYHHCLKHSRKATKAEYAPLLDELTKIVRYDLKVYQRKPKGSIA